MDQLTIFFSPALLTVCIRSHPAQWKCSLLYFTTSISTFLSTLGCMWQYLSTMRSWLNPMKKRTVGCIWELMTRG